MTSAATAEVSVRGGKKVPVQLMTVAGTVVFSLADVQGHLGRDHLSGSDVIGVQRKLAPPNDDS
jgi:hypothetical protein